MMNRNTVVPLAPSLFKTTIAGEPTSQRGQAAHNLKLSLAQMMKSVAELNYREPQSSRVDWLVKALIPLAGTILLAGEREAASGTAGPTVFATYLPTCSAFGVRLFDPSAVFPAPLVEQVIQVCETNASGIPCLQSMHVLSITSDGMRAVIDAADGHPLNDLKRLLRQRCSFGLGRRYYWPMACDVESSFPPFCACALYHAEP
jgi:hypothetical protein